MFTFRKSTEDEEKEMYKLGYGGEWIYGAAAREETFALFLGKVITRFGTPENLSKDWECMYSIPVTCEDESGSKLVLEVYHGPGGPSISMPCGQAAESMDLEPYKQAKAELIEYITGAEPSDYEWESVDEDIPVNVKYTVKDGKVKVESEFPEGMEDFDPEEFM